MNESTLLIGVIIVVLIVVVMLRRLRAQPVSPTRVATTALIFVAVLLFSLYEGSGRTLLGDVVALAAIPVALAAGVVVGWVLVRFMHFWSDPATNQLWMRGGILFAVIYMVALLLRLGASYVGRDATLTARYHWLPGVSADLIFFSIGLWITRAVCVYLRYRRHVAAGGAPASLSGARF